MRTPSPAPGTETTAAKAPRRRWRRRLFFLVATILVLLLLAPLLVGLGPVRTKIASTIGERLGRRVEISASSAFWGQGVDIEGLTIHSPEGFDGPLVTVERIHIDFDIFALLGGRLSARVRIVEPHITLRTDAAGHGNQAGLLEHLQGESTARPSHEPAQEPSQGEVDLELIVIGGRVERTASATAPANVVDDVQITLAASPDGRKLLALEARVVGAAKGGGDVALQATADIDGTGTGPITCHVPALDLSYLARLVESATGLRDLRGSIECKLDATLQGDDTLNGSLHVSAQRLSVTTAEGARVSLHRLDAQTDLRSVARATEAKWNIRAGDLRVERGTSSAAGAYREPSITFVGEGRYSPADGLLRIASTKLDAGATASVVVSAPVRVETGPVLRVQGKATARVDLGRLGALGALLPPLKPLAGGTLQAAFDGRGGEGIDADVTVDVAGLQLRPSDAIPEGYADRHIVLTCNVQHNATTGTRLTLHRVQSAVMQASFQKDRGLAFTLDPKGAMGVDGAFQIRVMLEQLSIVIGRRLGLERGERLTGAVTVAGSGVAAGSGGEAGRMRLDVTVQAENVGMPSSWDETGTRANLRALVRAEGNATHTEIRVSELSGMGLSGEGRASLEPGGDGLRLTQASGTLGIQLEAARSWLGGFADLGPRERLAGHLTATLRLMQEDELRRLTATAQVTDFRWDRGRQTAPVQERRMSAHANVVLAPEGGRHRAEELRLDTGGLRLDLSGSSYVAGPDRDVDATLRLGGDAAKLAPLVSALLGEGYEDLRGLGPLSGELVVRGSPSENGRSLIVKGRLGLASWSTAGLELTNVALEAERATTADPLTASVAAGVNKGTVRVDTRARLGAAAVPWSATMKVAHVDTSGLLVSRGVGQYLAYALPALLPAGTDTPVLSGLLDMDLQGGAPSIDNPALADGLRGQGTLHMAGGEIKQSTLFGGGTGTGLAKVISLLKVAVPAAGSVMQELSQAVTFSTLDSRFRVADRVVTLEEAKLVGKSAHIDMRGRVDFEERVALDANVILQGGGGRALAKVLPGGVIPLRVGGTLEKPHVNPNVDLSKLAAGGLGGKIGGLLDRFKKKKLPGGIPNPFK